MDFWSARFLWQEPLFAAVVGAALLGYLGFFVVLRRIAFMSAALSQVSGLGVATAFWVGSFFGVEPHSTEGSAIWFSPAAFALVFACVGAVAVSLPSRSRRVTPESVVALGYLAASAMVIVVLSSPRIAQEAHEIGDLLFGNAVVVKHEHLIQLCIAAAVVFTIHRLFFKDFLFCSYEPETARSMRYPVRCLRCSQRQLVSFTIASLSLFLAVLGLYGVVTYMVKMRVREVGVRMALGAQRSDVRKMILKCGAELAVIGSVMGIFATFVVGRTLSSLLYQVKLYNPATLISTSALLAVVVLVASSLPAWRASNLNPMETLRNN